MSIPPLAPVSHNTIFCAGNCIENSGKISLIVGLNCNFVRVLLVYLLSDVAKILTVHSLNYVCQLIFTTFGPTLEVLFGVKAKLVRKQRLCKSL